MTANDSPFINPDVWESLSTGEPIPDGADVVLGLDGSFGGQGSDCTALVACTIDKAPHADLIGCWQAADSPEARIDVLAVEQAVRDAHKRFHVRQVIADPFRWRRSLHILQAEGMTVVEFPWSPARVTKATTDLFSAAMNGNLTHSGNPTLATHVMASTVIESPSGGLRVGKTSRSSKAAKIDACAALVMAHSGATYLATRKTKPKRTVAF